MRSAVARLVLPVLAASALGCAGGGLARWAPCADGLEAAARARGVSTTCRVLRDPVLLVEQARDAFGQGDLGGAYDYLALVHALHPGSVQNREVFPLSARIFVVLHFRYRSQPDRWDTSEPRFLFGWLEQFFAEDRALPQRELDSLFIGARAPLFRDFVAYAEGRPALTGWQLSAERDNGIIRSVSGSPRATPPPRSSRATPACSR